MPKKKSRPSRKNRRRQSKGSDTKRRFYFYWKYRKEHPERFSEKKRQEAALSEELGASKGMAGFLASTAHGPGIVYRIRYGFIDENNLGSTRNSKVTGIIRDYGKVTQRYKAMAWLRDRDPKGRKFIVIEKSNDGGKTWPTKLFHDCQR